MAARRAVVADADPSAMGLALVKGGIFLVWTNILPFPPFIRHPDRTLTGREVWGCTRRGSLLGDSSVLPHDGGPAARPTRRT